MTRTIIETKAEIFRNERGIHLAAFGQTFTPRPGSDSAKVLSDEALKAQLVEATKFHLHNDTTNHKSGWSASYEPKFSRMGLSIGGVFDLGDSSISVLLAARLGPAELIVQESTYTKLNKDHESEIVQIGISEEAFVARTIINLLSQIIELVPELKARGTKVVFEQSGSVTSPTPAPARTLMPGDVIEVTEVVGSELRRNSSYKIKNVAMVVIDGEPKIRVSSGYLPLIGYTFHPEHPVSVITRASS